MSGVDRFTTLRQEIIVRVRRGWSDDDSRWLEAKTSGDETMRRVAIGLLKLEIAQHQELRED